MRLDFLCLGIFVHLLLLYSIFDIYYSSPIVVGAKSYPIVPNNANSAPAPAARLVFFSADGLHARSFFDHPDRSPFLHSIIQDGKAAWGVAQSHVPTESRPGHVALMAGFYEDVSAVTKGWKHNPVPFDTTLNHSARAFLWGSPDIVHLFSTTLPHSHAEVYSPELEDFASDDAAKLDKWVFDRVENIFQRAVNNGDAQMANWISTKRSIFFLHLLGLDTNGHGFKPKSETYLANIRTVDDGVRRMVKLFETHFNDNKTVYLFTADHGMTDWGSHGDGTADEVRVPFVAWGAGIRPSIGQQQPAEALAQVDICPLQSALIGSAIPVNSFGIVPVNMLATTAKYQFQAAYANFKQMSEQLRLRRAERRSHSFRPFFAECPSLRFDALVKIENEILRLAQLKRYEAAWKVCIKWIPLIREALNYFHRYHQFSQGLAIGALFCTWNLFLYASLFGDHRHNRHLLAPHQFYAPTRPFLLLLCLAAFLVWAQGLPSVNHLYFLSPIFLLSAGLNMLLGPDWMGEKLLKKGIDGKKREMGGEWAARGIATAMAFFIKKRAKIVGTIFMLAVLSTGLLVSVFFERAILSLIFMLLSPFCWFFLPSSQKRSAHFQWLPLSWFLLCLALAIFPLLPSVGTSPRPILVIFAEFYCCAALRYYQTRRFPQQHKNLAMRIGECFHWIVLALLIWDAFVDNTANPLIRCMAWLSPPLAFALPFLPISSGSSTSAADRLLLWTISLQLPYALLSLAHEALFLCLFSSLLFLYFQLEKAAGEGKKGGGGWKTSEMVDNKKEEKQGNGNNKNNNNNADDDTNCLNLSEADRNWNLVSPSEWIRALLLVICIEMAFFGTGNIASLNSFNPSFLRHFLSVFSPFTMAALLLLKVFIPFLLVTLHFVAAATEGAAKQQQQRQLTTLSTLVAIITNTMAIAFFYCLRTDGSWLQIGISISNYVICLVCGLCCRILLHFSHFLLHFQFPSFSNLTPPIHQIPAKNYYL